MCTIKGVVDIKQDHYFVLYHEFIDPIFVTKVEHLCKSPAAIGQ